MRKYLFIFLLIGWLGKSFAGENFISKIHTQSNKASSIVKADCVFKNKLSTKFYKKRVKATQVFQNFLFEDRCAFFSANEKISAVNYSAPCFSHLFFSNEKRGPPFSSLS